LQQTLTRPAWRNRAVILWGSSLGQLVLALGLVAWLDGRPGSGSTVGLFGTVLLAGLAHRQHRHDGTRLQASDLPWVLAYAVLMVGAVIAGVSLHEAGMSR